MPISELLNQRLSSLFLKELVVGASIVVEIDEISAIFLTGTATGCNAFACSYDRTSWLPLLRFNPQPGEFPWDDLHKIFRG